ncbi:MAG TPA: hypothetical protein VGW40_02860 [Allosphingosinicella sp.]|nr:hypothetical protein [Allosphingosinicella sp.]
MADEADDKPEGDGITDVFAHLDDKDWFLQSLIELADIGIELGVTLSAQGMLISGILISGKRYFEQLSEDVKSGTGPNASEKIVSLISRSFKQFVVIYEKPEDAGDDWKAPKPAYVHLRDARFFMPGQPPLPNNKGVLWRGKLNRVTGFVLANLTAE